MTINYFKSVGWEAVSVTLTDMYQYPQVPHLCNANFYTKLTISTEVKVTPSLSVWHNLKLNFILFGHFLLESNVMCYSMSKISSNGFMTFSLCVISSWLVSRTGCIFTHHCDLSDDGANVRWLALYLRWLKEGNLMCTISGHVQTDLKVLVALLQL